MNLPNLRLENDAQQEKGCISAVKASYSRFHIEVDTLLG